MRNLGKSRWLTQLIRPLMRRGRKAKSIRGTRRPVLEQLESRTLLTGDFTNAPIDDAEMATLLDGIDGFAAFGSELDRTGQFAKPLALATCRIVCPGLNSKACPLIVIVGMGANGSLWRQEVPSAGSPNRVWAWDWAIGEAIAGRNPC
jgi:hypothetical protein